jgi:ribonucleoside-diphosphate reductase alpha chain
MYFKFIDYEDVKNITAEDYFSNDSYAVGVFNKKYAFSKGGSVMETPAEVFWRVAYNIGAVEEDENKAKELAKVWFSLMWEGWYRPGGSVLAGVESERKVSLCNCTTVPISEDTLDAIGAADTEMMKMASRRQGLGFDLSNLRPKNSLVNNSAVVSDGVVNWLKKYDDIALRVGQRGRIPALLGSLKISHPDIEDFIKAKDTVGAIENINISVQIEDKFMTALEKDEDWQLLFNVAGGREVVSSQVKAKELFRKIASHARDEAEPGIQYCNLLQRGLMYNAVAIETNDSRYFPVSSNACSEKFMAPYSVCNLLSLNMEMFSTDSSTYKEELNEMVPYFVRFADNVITYELDKDLSPLEKQKWIVEQLREIGLGVTNIHGWLLKQELAYDSNEAILAVENFMKYYAYNVFLSSVQLGGERGSAPAWDLVEDKTKYMSTTYFKNIVNEFFGGDASGIFTMRNMAHMSIAPTGSLSSTFPSPCISSGVEPVMGLYYWRKTRALGDGNYQYYFMIPHRLLEYILTKINKDSEDYKALASFSGAELDESGELGKKLITIINKYIPEGFIKASHEIDPLQKIKLMSHIYKWMDASISCTFNMKETTSVEEVEQVYIEAYKNGVRAVSIYRDGSRAGIYIFEDPITNKAKHETKKIEKKRPDMIVPVYSPKRPKELPCNIHHCSIKGTPWLVLVGMFNNVPYEVFAGESEDLYLPKICKNGKIIKCSDGTYSLVVTIRKSEVEYKNLAYLLMDTEQRALTRLISLSIRHGCPLEFVQKQLKKANGDITNFSTVVARVLGAYVRTVEVVGEESKCPLCGKNTMVREEGCMHCSDLNCGYGRCE